jgi:hypothetical protein
MSAVPIGRRTFFKSVGALGAAATFDGIFQSAGAIDFSGTYGPTKPEEESTMNAYQSVESSWLAPQVGFQLAHEQFTVPELLELGRRRSSWIRSSRGQRSFSAVAGKRRAFGPGVGHNKRNWTKNKAHPHGNHGDLSDISIQPRRCRGSVRIAESLVSRANFPRPWLGRGIERRGGRRLMAEVAGTLGALDRSD